MKLTVQVGKSGFSKTSIDEQFQNETNFLLQNEINEKIEMSEMKRVKCTAKSCGSKMTTSVNDSDCNAVWRRKGYFSGESVFSDNRESAELMELFWEESKAIKRDEAIKIGSKANLQRCDTIKT